jgi:hypothetical protein
MELGGTPFGCGGVLAAWSRCIKRGAGYSALPRGLRAAAKAAAAVHAARRRAMQAQRDPPEDTPWTSRPSFLQHLIGRLFRRRWNLPPSFLCEVRDYGFPRLYWLTLGDADNPVLCRLDRRWYDTVYRAVGPFSHGGWVYRMHPPELRSHPSKQADMRLELLWPVLRKNGRLAFDLGWVELVRQRSGPLREINRGTYCGVPFDHVVPLPPRP